MKLLMIDTSTIVATAAVVDENRLIAETIVNYKKKHSEKMLPAIDHLFQDSGMKLSDMDAFGVVNGPGSFTGLRIGMATAKGFAQALEKPIVTVSTLESLAYNACVYPHYICPVIDAQRGQVYAALYRFEGNTMNSILTSYLSEGVYGIDTLIEEIKAKNEKEEPVLFLGDGLKKHGRQLSEISPKIQLMPAYFAMNRASSAAAAGYQKLSKGETVNYFQAGLNYLRKSSAEEQMEKKQGKIDG
jgi:tRNA threonylcarbamoyladenosine biosynthesis protein TsaB